MYQIQGPDDIRKVGLPVPHLERRSTLPELGAPHRGRQRWLSSAEQGPSKHYCGAVKVLVRRANVARLWNIDVKMVVDSRIC